MAQLVLGAAGAVVGFYAGGPTGAQIGWAIGSAVGGAYEASRKKIEGPRINDLRVMGTEYGDPIPYLIGNPRVAGQIWWASDKRAVANSQQEGKGGGPTITNYTYEVDLLVGLSDNEIVDVSRVWSNGTLVYNRLTTASDETLATVFRQDRWRRMTVYTGAADQLPDPTYEAAVGVADAPAYRGRGSVFFEGLQLDGSGQLPNLTFEVITAGASRMRAPAATGIAIATASYINAGTVALSDATTYQVMIGDWTTSYASTGMSVYQVDLFEPGVATVVSTFNVSVAAVAAHGNSDQPLYVSNDFESNGARHYTASGSRSSQYAFTESYGGAQIRFSKVGSDIVFGSQAFGSKRLRRYAFGGGAAAATSSALGDFVNSIMIVGDKVYAAAVTSKVVYRLALSDLSLEATIDRPYTGGSSDSWPILVDIGGRLAILSLKSSGAARRMHLLNNDGSTWTEISDDISATYIQDAHRCQSIGVVGALIVSGLMANSSSQPNTYSIWSSAITITPEDATVQGSVEAICERAGLATTQIDASDLASITRPVRAMALAQIDASRGAIEQLRSAYAFDAVLADKLYFRPRGTAVVRTLAYDEIGAGAERASEDPLPLSVASALELPAQIAVLYRNASNDFQIGTEYSDRLVSEQRATQTVQLALGLTPAEAKGVADTIGTDALASLVTTTLSVTREHTDLEPGDVIQATTAAGALVRLRIVRRRDEPAAIAVECVRDDASVIESEELTDETYDEASDVVQYGESDLRFLDLPILRDADDDAGFYVAARAESGSTWPGAEVQLSSDNSTFTTVATVSEAAVFGSCTTTLGNAAAGGAVIDELNTLAVSMGAGELASSTRAAMMADETINVLQVGSEIVRFITATQTGSNPNTYTLSRLWRGQLGTESHISTHGASESCCLLRMQGLRRVTRPTSEIDQLRYLRAVTLGRSATYADVDSVTNTGLGLKPWAPVDLRAELTSTGYTVSWQRRTRLKTRFASSAGINVPLGEASESYEVELLTSGDVLVNTTTVSEASIDLTAANLVGTLPIGVARDHESGGTHYGVDIEGNTNSTLRRLVAQTTAGVSQTSPYLGSVLVDACYTATDAYTAAMYLTATVPSAYSDTYVQRFDLADITSAAATYTAGTAGDVVGLTHDGTDLWILEQSSLRLRRLDDSTLVAAASHALTGPVEFGLANDGTRLFFCDQGDAVGWTIGTTTEAWRTALPSGYIMVVGIVVAGGNVFIATRAGVCVYDAAAGTLVDQVDLQVYAPPGTYCAALAVHGSDVACCLVDGTVVVLDGATAAEAGRFASNGYAMAGSDGTTIWVSGQSAPTVVGVDQTSGYELIGGSLAGYKARVYQMSATVGRGYPATLTL